MYEKLFEQQEEVFKVLSNKKRLEIIQLLTHGEMSVSEMVAMLGIPQSNVSQHLGLLRQVSAVTTRKNGTTTYYSLKDAKLADACRLIRQFLVDEDKLPAVDLLGSDLTAIYPLAVDPVCGMRLSPTEASEQLSHDGRTYLFCASGCRDKFEAHPENFVQKATAKEA